MPFDGAVRVPHRRSDVPRVPEYAYNSCRGVSRGITVAMTAARRETYHPERVLWNRVACTARPVAAIIAAFSVKLVLSVRTRVIPKLPRS